MGAFAHASLFSQFKISEEELHPVLWQMYSNNPFLAYKDYKNIDLVYNITL